MSSSSFLSSGIKKAATTATPLLEIRDLSVSFEIEAGRRVQATRQLGMTIHPGQTLAVVGESGCGKSVTALATLQLIACPPGRIDSGSILFRERDLLTLPERKMLRVRGREIAMVFQEPMTSLNPVYSIGDQIVEAIRLHQKVTRSEAIDIAEQTLEDVGIAEPKRRMRSYPHEFSGGMRQRVMTAMAICCRPALLLADEPTTALDVTIQKQILKLLRGIQAKRDMAMMLITHDLGVVAQNADVVCVMYAGRVVEYADVRSLFEKAYHPYTRGLLGSIPSLRARSPRLTTVAEIVNDPAQFTQLPGHGFGIVPWWPDAAPPDDLAPDARADTIGPNATANPSDVGSAYSLYEIEPGHWVGCWRTEYLADHPATRPNVVSHRADDGV